MGLSDLTAPAVNQAIEEFKQLKRKAFLKKYKFGPHAATCSKKTAAPMTQRLQPARPMAT
jgi:hypothetical protein